MTDIVLSPITSGYNLGKINANFDEVQRVINDEVVHSIGGNNTMHQNLDMNGFDLLNINTNPNNPDSLLTREAADALYYNVAGDTLTGTMQVGGQTLIGLKAPVGPTEAMRKQEFDFEVAARIASDESLQSQITEGAPPTGSAFSVISWHDQQVANSIVVPANKNAWSFGPTLTINPGQVVTIGANSFWTIANGEVTP